MNNSNRSLIAAASHLGWLIPIPFLGTGAIYFLYNDREIREHARQAIFYQLAMLIVAMLMFSGSFFLAMLLPAALIRLFSLAMMVVCLAFLIPPVLGAVSAYQGKRYEYPVVGGMAHLLPLP